MKVLKVIGIVLVFGLLSFGIMVGGNYMKIWQIEFFGTKIENAHRKVYENTQSFRTAKKQALNKYYLEFQSSEPDEKVAIKNVILMEFADYDLNDLNSTQYQWYNEIVNYTNY